MSKSQLTKNIERALSSYSPSSYGDFEFNYRRKHYLEFECPVTHSHIEDGIVDAIWLAEGYNNHRVQNYCKGPDLLRFSKGINKKWDSNICHMNEQTLKEISYDTFIPCEKDCVYRREMKNKDECFAIICFEIKISREDFKSKNGHNFIGNMNYYVMPFQLYKNIKNEIPEDIGCITYHYKDENEVGKLRLQKQSVYNKELNTSLYNSLLHTIVNRKDKIIRRIVSESNAISSSQIQNFSAALTSVMEEMKKLVDEPDCYNSNYYGCSNCTPVQIRCSKCPYGTEYKRLLLEKVDGRKKLNEYLHTILR